MRERLWPRWWVWLLLISLVALLAWAYGLALGAPVGFVVFVAGGLLVVIVVWVTAPVIEITTSSLRVDGAVLPRQMISGVRVLRREDIQSLRGPGADARLYVELRPWSTTQAVLIDVCDPADPHPAWLLSSRHPDALAVALSATMGTHDGQSPGHSHGPA